VPLKGSAWLTVRDAAKLSGYHPEYITRLIRVGTIRARKISIVWLVDCHSLTGYTLKVKSLGRKRGRKPADLR
jgi:hypothetical protein